MAGAYAASLLLVQVVYEVRRFGLCRVGQTFLIASPSVRRKHYEYAVVCPALRSAP